MAIHIPNSFTSFEWENEREELEAKLLTIAQRQNVQNEIAVCAELRLALTPDFQNLYSYAQQEAYERGKQDAFQQILDEADAAEAAIRNSVSPPPEE